MSAVQTTIKLNDMMSPALKKMMSTMDKVIKEFEDFQDVANNSWDSSKADEMRRKMDSMGNSVRQLQNGMQDFGSETQTATKATDGLESSIGRIATAIGGIMGIRQIADWVGTSLESANVENSAKAQLQATMKNMGNSSDYDRVLKKADEIQQAGIYGNEAMIKAGAEFATYLSDTSAIEMMMDTLTDYASGMTGGGAVSAEQMVDLATQLGKALNGSYDGLTKKGFQFTDAQKAINAGTATEAQLVEVLGKDYKTLTNDMKKAQIVAQVVGESWDGMYEAMSNTPEGAIIQMKNAWGDVQEVIGNALYPSVQLLADTLTENLPEIQDFLLDISTPIKTIVEDMAQVVQWTVEHKEEVKLLAGALLTVAGVYATIEGAIWLAKTAQEALNFACDTNPFLALLSIILMIAGSLLLAKNMDEQFQENVRVGWESAFGAIMLILEALMTPIYMIILALQTVAMTIQDAFITAFNTVGSYVAQICYNIIKTVENVANAISSLFGVASTGFSNFLHEAGETVYKAKIVADYNNSKVDWSDNAKNLVNYATQGAVWTENGRNMTLEMAKNGADWLLNKAGVTGYTGKDLLGDYNINVNTPDLNLSNSGLGADVSNIAGNTGKMAKSLDITDEEIKYLRDIAERDAINKFTTASIKVDMNNTNNINSDMDIDGIVRSLETKLYDSLVSTAEGVHV